MLLTQASLRAHLVDELLPMWAGHGLDREAGGYWNRLDASLAPTADGYKRLVVHARQLYAFSRALELGAGSWAAEAAAHGFEFLTRRFWDASHGGWFLTTTDQGAPLDRSKDLYGQAFALFGLSEHHRVTRLPESLRLARETLELLRTRMRAPQAGGFWERTSEDWRPLPGPRLQNPHMHLVEALLAFEAVAPGEAGLRDAGELVELLASRWADRQTGALCESFDARWQPSAGEAGQAVEPGHCFEWYALLRRFSELSGSAEVLPLADRLLGFADRHGLDADGGVFDRVDRSGRPLHSRKRLWPQTEHLKARALVTASRPSARPRLEAALEHCSKRYRDPATGGWREHLARDGRVVSEAQNATSVYHVVTALTEVLRVAD